MTKENIIGKMFGKLTVLDDYISVYNGRKYKCICECGNTTYVYRGKLTTGHTKSCGCLSHSRSGLSKTRLYKVWSNMKDRCNNSKNHAYKDYGGKGVKISDEWLDFDIFYKWSYENGYSEKLSIERIDSNGNYEPNNCEWITLSENVRRANKENNRRKPKYLYYGISPDNTYYTFDNANVFAKEHNLNGNSITRVVREERLSYKKWKFGFTDIEVK